MVLQSWIIDCLKMRKISRKTWKTVKWNWQFEKKTLAEVKIRRGILKGNSLSPFLTARCHSMTHLENALGAINLQNRKINHLLHKKKWERIENSYTINKNIQSGYGNGIWHWKICILIMRNEKNTNNRRNWSIKSGKLQELRNIGRKLL